MPSTTNFVTAEYSRSNASTSSNAITAYQAGATGAGVTVAVIDSGINPALPEFAGRISAASADIAGNRGVSDEDGHGTSIAGVIAAARDNSGPLGVAFDATILSLRTDRPGSCAEEDGCAHADSDIARGIDAAVAANAKVINLSLGGTPASTGLRNAVQRATRAGIVIVISAGNEGEADPDALAQLANTLSVSNGLIIVAGAVDANNMITSFSDRAGNTAQYFLGALGDRVRGFDHTGAAFLFSGTSYSAPVVAGAVALLRQAYPTLTGAQIVDLILRTANDAGDAGTDAIYGRGILNIANAFRPQGAASLAGSAIAVSLSDNGELGGAFGDGGEATGQALEGAVILDGYGRAFTLNIAKTIRTAPVSRVLANLADRSVSGSGSQFGAHYTLTVVPAASTRPWVGLAQAGLDNRAGDRDRPRQGLVSSRIGTNTMIGAALGYAPETLASAVGGGWSDGGFLAAGRGGFSAGLQARAGTALAVARKTGPWTLSLSAGQANIDDPRPGLRDAGSAETVAVRAERALGPVRLAAGLSQLRESDTLLGSRSASLGLGGATTRFASLEARADLGGGWSLSGDMRGGWSEARPGAGLIDALGTVRSSGFEATLSKAGLFGGDRLAFRIAQPLRVESAAARFTLPVSYDYATLATGFEARQANLAPTGREIDAEAVYAVAIGGGNLDTHVFWRREPGHVAGRDADLGAAVRFSTSF